MYSQIRINEVCSSNNGSFYDEKHNTPDWIELYNYSNEPVNLSNWSISDKSDYSSAWQLPDTTIQPGGYFVVCASGKDTVLSTIRLISNGVTDVYNLFEDQYGWAYLELNGNNTIEYKYDSFEAEYLTEKKISIAGIVIKEKNESKSRMFSFFNSSDEGRQFYIHSRSKEDEYRGVGHLKDRIKLDDITYQLEIKNDSIYHRMLDENKFVMKESKFEFPLKDNYYVGFTTITYDSSVYDTLNINYVKINDKLLNYEDFNTKSFHDISVEFYNEKLVHTDFKLNNSMDSVYLFLNSSLKDTLAIPNLAENVSYSNHGYYSNPTPGLENSEAYSSVSTIEDIELNSSFYNDINEFISFDSSYCYTTDYSIPDTNSKKLSEHENISSQLLTIKRFEENKVASEQKKILRLNRKDVLNDEFHFHLHTKSDNLFNYNSGIISNTFSNAKVDAYLGITKSDENIFSGEIELRKHGNYSNINRLQSSLRLIFDKKKYESIDEILFPDRLKNYGKSIILRNGGNDISTMLRNRLSMKTAEGLNLDWNEHNNAIVYLNSEFWGVYNLRERIDDDYLAEKYNVDKDKINAFENEFNLKYGSPKEMMELNEFLLSDTLLRTYVVIDSVVDIENFIDYIFLNTFNINHDWPHNNVVGYSFGEKWKFLVTDLDYSYKLKGAGASVNNISNVFNESSGIVTRLLNELLRSKEFRTNYINRACDLLNTKFSKDSLLSKFNTLKTEYSNFVKLQNSRWPETLSNWENDIYVIERFLSRRTDFYYNHLQQFFDKEPSTLYLASFPNTAGTFKVNSLNINKSNWEGRYLQEVPVKITAVAKHGFKFKKWKIDSLGDSSTINITLSDTMNIEAIYEEIDPTKEDTYLVINEIMYNADKDNDTKDWIEIYNAGKESVNLFGWSIIDEDESHTPFVIEEEYMIKPDEFVVLTRSETDFAGLINIENKLFGDFDFGFGGNDIVVLKDAVGNTHDSVNYDNNLPWPEGADGTGYTIELINPKLDNNNPDNWEISQLELGTPGVINSVYFDIVSRVDNSKKPNFYHVDFIENILTISSSNRIVEVIITDTNGKIQNPNRIENINTLTLDMNYLPNGKYIVKVRDINHNSNTFKIISD